MTLTEERITYWLLNNAYLQFSFRHSHSCRSLAALLSISKFREDNFSVTKSLLFHLVGTCYITYTWGIFNFDRTITYLLSHTIYSSFHLLLLASSGDSYAKIFSVEMILILHYGENYLNMVRVSNPFPAQSNFWHCTIASSCIIILKQRW